METNAAILSNGKHSFPSNSVSSASLHRHRWYPIKEGFSQELVDRFLDESSWSPDKVVLEPFCGSGTVPLTIRHRGGYCVGIEVNPFLAFVARCKLSELKAIKEEAASGVIAGVESGSHSPLEGFSTFAYRRGLDKWLFNRPILRGFEGAWQSTTGWDADTCMLVQLALISATMACCNAFADGKCLRYRKNWKQLRFATSDLRREVSGVLHNIREDLLSLRLPRKGAVRIDAGDCRKLLAEQTAPRFDLCITSPPYLNSFDYTDVYRPQLFLGKFVSSMEQLRQLRLQTLRSHVQTSWELPKHDKYGRVYLETMSLFKTGSLVLWDARIPTMIQAYFEDMRLILRLLRNRANTDAKLWIVVATSAYSGVHIPVDVIISEIASHNGWTLDEIETVRQLRSSGQQWHGIDRPCKRSQALREVVVKLRAR